MPGSRLQQHRVLCQKHCWSQIARLVNEKEHGDNKVCDKKSLVSPLLRPLPVCALLFYQLGRTGKSQRFSIEGWQVGLVG